MSDKDFLKQSFKQQLEQKHKLSLTKRFGQTHPLCARQEISLAKETIKKTNCENKFMAEALLSFAQQQRKDIKEQKKLIKAIDRSQLDDLIDSVLDVKDALSDIKTNFLENPISIPEDLE